ncbi:FAD-dependent oxidoreductase [Actinomadura oligospora]|uniref:FAD-dependent oxidoreductase n=1 Tax=Actinomadura oligospora TaxID=111804 RepID=UPI00055721E0|nr:FAD-dependent oxidoreductase [Actinomadura oligospora]
MAESVVGVFDELVAAGPPGRGRVLVDTACVVGGSVSGLLAARVLSDHAREVVIVERDDISGGAGSRPGTPHDLQVHTLLPAGLHWIERWLPGFTQRAQDLGAVLSGTATSITAFDGRLQAATHDDRHVLLMASRPFLEARIRERVTALPNVRVVRARAAGLVVREDEVRGVRHADGVVEADFVVDAMGRSSRLAEWLGDAGLEKPRLERLRNPINYATALFERPTPAADLDVAAAIAVYAQGLGATGLSVASLNAIEDDQWLVLVMGYGQERPGRTLAEFRAACSELPGVFAQAASGAPTRDIATYHQGESRRRDFTGLRHFPARLVGVGDSVASFNPAYGQGMSSAALQASCLSAYLTSGPDLSVPAEGFFDLQQVVVDAAWSVSTGGDTERLEAAAGIEPPEEVRRQRQVLRQLLEAGLVDPFVARALNDISYMLRHPAAMADPALLERAAAATSATPH